MELAAAQMSPGNAFHADGSACEKEHLSNLVHNCGSADQFVDVDDADWSVDGWHWRAGRCSLDVLGMSCEILSA